MPEVRVAAVSDIPPGTARELTVGERVVALFNVEGTIYALDGICRHAGGPIGKGTLQGDVVTCPWHGWQYHVKSGQHCLTPRIQQERFEVIVRGDDVYVLMDNGLGAP